jgi:hypothetical protein
MTKSEFRQTSCINMHNQSTFALTTAPFVSDAGPKLVSWFLSGDDGHAMGSSGVGCWSAFFGCALERLPLWPGLSRPSTQRRLKDEADIAAIRRAKAHRTRLSGRVPHSLRPTTWMAGTSPAMTPSFAAAGSPPQFRIPTTDSQRYESHAIAWQKPKRVLHISVSRIGWVSAGQWQKG